jgi:hypothetical protein
MTEPTDKCANPACHCIVPAGNLYCCEKCARVENDPETGYCLCEHNECEEAQVL